MTTFDPTRAEELVIWLDLGCEPYESHRHRLNEQRAAAAQLRAAVQMANARRDYDSSEAKRAFDFQCALAACQVEVDRLRAERALLVRVETCARSYVFDDVDLDAAVQALDAHREESRE